MQLGLVAGVLLLLALFTYRFIFFSFFQQDEWYSLGQALSGGIFSGISDLPFLYYLAGYIRYPGTLLNNTLHYYFPFNTLPFAVLAITLHWINSVLLYIYTLQLTKKQTVAIIASIFFLVSTVHQQSISWFAATNTALPSLLFSLLALTFGFRGIEKRDWKLIILAQFLMVVSFLFKESSIVLFLLLPFYYIYQSRFSLKNLVSVVQLFIPTLLYVFFVIGIRFLILYSPEGRVGVFVTTEANSKHQILNNIISYPIIGVSQTFIPAQLFFQNIMKYESNYQKVIQIMDTGSILLSLFLLTILLFICFRNRNNRKIISVSLFIMFAGFIPLAVLNRDNTSYFESRYYYISSMGAGIILGFFVSYILAFLRSKHTSLGTLVSFLVIIVIAAVFYKNISLTRGQLLQQNIESAERVKILTEIKFFFPTLRENPVFLVDGDSTGYYGIPKQRLPFQQGIGYTLMTLYYPSGLIPKELLNQAFLWDVTTEGYREIHKKGFGYYSSIESLKNAYKRQAFQSIDQIYAVYWDSHTKELFDITSETKQALLEESESLHEIRN